MDYAFYAEWYEFITSMNVPILDLGNYQDTYHGDYIDFIEEHQVVCPIMRGIDNYRRPFFVMKVYIEGKKQPFIETYFLRYTGEKYLCRLKQHRKLNNFFRKWKNLLK